MSELYTGTSDTPLKNAMALALDSMADAYPRALLISLRNLALFSWKSELGRPSW